VASPEIAYGQDHPCAYATAPMWPSLRKRLGAHHGRDRIKAFCRFTGRNAVVGGTKGTPVLDKH
jgi:hypothetical protein